MSFLEQAQTGVSRRERPRVSVLVNTYNHEKFIAQAIESVLAQDFPREEMEIVVVDDGSIDRTPEILRRFEPHIRILRKPNGGQVSAYNAGVPECHGKIVAFLDADDWWTKDKLSAVSSAFAEHPDAAAVGHGFIQLEEQTGTQEIFLPARNYRLTFENAQSARFACSGRGFLAASKLAVPKDLLMKIGPLPEEMIFCFDTAVQTLAMAYGPAIILEQALCYYRIHPRNLYQSRTPDLQMLHRKYQMLKTRIDFLPKRLAESHVPPEVITGLLETDELECEQLRLMLNGGWTWETFALERRRTRLAYQNRCARYDFFKSLVLCAALLLPPRIFYRGRSWYAQHNLKRFRAAFGEPMPADAISLQKSRSSAQVEQVCKV